MALLAAIVLAAPARAQDAQVEVNLPDAGERSVLVILDGSDSMNEDAGNGGTRLDAAKAALGELIDAVPDGARVGLRVYGNTLAPLPGVGVSPAWYTLRNNSG